MTTAVRTDAGAIAAQAPTGELPASALPSFENDVQSALRNATKLGLSLIGTWGVAMIVRVLLPRQLGPSLFGSFQFADAFTSGLFVLASLGIETYVRREVAIRRSHAAEFYGGLLLLRVLLAAILVAGALIGLEMAGKPPVVLRLVLVLGVTQFFVVQNATLAALLHATGEVDGLSVLSVGSKIVWGAGIVIGLVAGEGVVSVAIAMLVSEVLKMAALEVLARRHVALRLRFDVRATVAVIVGSLPFFVAGLSQALVSKINIAVMSFLVGDTELGWYGAASSFAGIALLMSPLLSWVLLPITARAESRSPDELMRLTQRAMRLVLTVSVPLTLLLSLGSDVLVRLLFGPSFEHAILSMRMLAPVFVLTYVGIVSSGALVGQGRGWTVTFVLLTGLIISPALNWLLIPRALAMLGPGGGGAGAATALVCCEGFNAVLLTAALGRRAFDRRTVVMVAKMAVVCAAVVAVDRLALHAYGFARVAADAALYLVLSVAWSAGDYEMLRSVLARVFHRKERSHGVSV